MIFKRTKIQGVYIIELEQKIDERGYFARVFSKDQFKKHSANFSVIQINRAMSLKRGIIRGLHMQKRPKAEDKLTQCLSGSIFDVAVDLRKNSKTYGQYVSDLISSDNKKMMLIPKGCAHGFQALENNTVVQYCVSQYYSPKYEVGVRWDDPSLNIPWPIKKALVSKKDANWPLLSL